MLAWYSTLSLQFFLNAWPVDVLWAVARGLIDYARLCYENDVQLRTVLTTGCVKYATWC